MNNVLNYTDFALESSIESLRLMNQHRLVHLSLESEFILECMDCGVLSPILEADKPNTIFGKAKEAIKNFFKKVLGLFRDRSKEKAEKYLPWIKDNVKSIKERSQNMTIEVTPYWKTDWRDDIKQMTSAVTKIFDNIKNGRFEDYTFANNLVKIEGNVSDTPNLKDKLIVRFSIGEKDKTTMQQVKVEKFGQTDIFDKMMEFMLNYTADMQNLLGQLEKDIERKLDQVSPKTITIKESNFFDIEDAPLCETDLITLINYTEVLTEAGNKNKKAHQGNDKKGTVNSEGEQTSNTSVKVNPDGDDGKGTPEENAKTGEEKESNEAKDNYISQCESFMKIMVSAFLTAAENRFVSYTNTMIAIGNAKGSPTRDDEGNVEDKEGEENKEEQNESEKKETFGSKLVKGAKKGLNKVTNFRAAATNKK